MWLLSWKLDKVVCAVIKNVHFKVCNISRNTKQSGFWFGCFLFLTVMNGLIMIVVDMIVSVQVATKQYKWGIHESNHNSVLNDWRVKLQWACWHYEHLSRLWLCWYCVMGTVFVNRLEVQADEKFQGVLACFKSIQQYIWIHNWWIRVSLLCIRYEIIVQTREL